MSGTDEIRNVLSRKTGEKQRTFAVASLAAIFGLAVGTAFTYNEGYGKGFADAKAVAAKTVRAPDMSSYVSDASYYHLCWSLRQVVQREAKDAPKGKPLVVEMNQATADKCPMTGMGNVKIKIAF